jgi:Tfp pilus assembly protein PilP
MHKTWLAFAALSLVPSMGLAEDYRYQPGRRDPFNSPLEKLAPPEDPQACNTPACAVDVAEMHLTGIATGMRDPMAMVDDGRGNSFVLKVGTPVGRHGGRVTSIGSHKVVITEVVAAVGAAPRPVLRTLAMDLDTEQLAAPITD